MKRFCAITILTLFICSAMTACASPFWRFIRLGNGAKTGSGTVTVTGASGDTTGSADSTTGESSDTSVTDNSLATTGGTGTTYKPAATTSTTVTPTTTSRPKTDTGAEMRAAWVSYIEIDNLLKGKSVSGAKSVIDGIMQNAKSYGLNAVIFHVRANSDAYYKSKKFNTAATLKNLIDRDGFDPLGYAVEAAHSRGLELHAWVNPYRIGKDKSYAKCSGAYDTFKSGDKYYYNPASSSAQSLILEGIEEIVNNYDVDGVQFDDYFYPNDTAVIPLSKPAAFEKPAYDTYKTGGGKLGIANWRRWHVSSLIASAYKKVHGIRKSCVFGVSPASDTNNNYSRLYADIKLWMKDKGYIDYICPQVYFGLLNSNKPFKGEVDKWTSYGRHSSVRLYIGLALYKIGKDKDESAGDGKNEWATNDDVMKSSLIYVRSKSQCGGVMFYSYTFFNPSSRSNDGSWSLDVANREVNNLLAVLRQSKGS